MESTIEEVSVDVILPLDVVMGADSKEITAGASDIHIEQLVNSFHKEHHCILVASSSLPLPTAAVVVVPPLESILTAKQIILSGNNQQADSIQDIQRSIDSLDSLLHQLLSSVDYHDVTSLQRGNSSPGFDTANNDANTTTTWTDIMGGSLFPHYETLDKTAVVMMHPNDIIALPGGNNGNDATMIPIPTVEHAVECYRCIREAWVLRLQWAVAASAASSKEINGNNNNTTTTTQTKFCSCIGQWEHFKGNVLRCLANQVIEHLMTREASSILRATPPCITDIWNNECYQPETCPTPDTMDSLYIDSTIRLLPSHEGYLRTYIATALKARNTIDICTCYIFHGDAATKYIFLDLLPYIAQKRGVKIRILLESMTMESQQLQRALGDSGLYKSSSSDTVLDSIIDGLEDAPSLRRAKQNFTCAADLLKEFFNVISSSSFGNISVIPDNIQVRWWIARDKIAKYRIKNHSKYNIFDGGDKKYGVVIAGGSNLVPRPASIDTDFAIQGEVAGLYSHDFDNMWNAMSGNVDDVSCLSLAEEKKEEEVQAPPIIVGDVPPGYPRLENHRTDDPTIRGVESKILFLPSQPNSSGEDVILRCVLGGIHRAETSIAICMGHFNIPLSVSYALKAATERGVKVSVIANSIYSCDLRGGQRDLFLSLKTALSVAPEVQLFVTAIKDGKKPPFLHSKYVVVDAKWTAVGSWNMWTRAAFYEKEAEVFVHSEAFAANVLDKFDKERNEYCVEVKTPAECDVFLPDGCFLCQGFGPFYDS